MEALYAFVADWNTRDGGLKASDDKTSSGQRYNATAKGIYFHTFANLVKVLDYARFAPVFNDGTMCRAYVKCRVDRTYRVPYKHTDQKVQMSNANCAESGSGGPSIFYESLWVQH